MEREFPQPWLQDIFLLAEGGGRGSVVSLLVGRVPDVWPDSVLHRVSGHGDRDRFDCDPGDQAGRRDPGRHRVDRRLRDAVAALDRAEPRNTAVLLRSAAWLCVGGARCRQAVAPITRAQLRWHAGALYRLVCGILSTQRIRRHFFLRDDIFRHLCRGPAGIEDSGRGGFAALPAGHNYLCQHRRVFSPSLCHGRAGR